MEKAALGCEHSSPTDFEIIKHERSRKVWHFLVLGLHKFNEQYRYFLEGLCWWRSTERNISCRVWKHSAVRNGCWSRNASRWAYCMDLKKLWMSCRPFMALTHSLVDLPRLNNGSKLADWLRYGSERHLHNDINRSCKRRILYADATILITVVDIIYCENCSSKSYKDNWFNNDAERRIVIGRLVCPSLQGILVETYLRSGWVTIVVKSKFEQLLEYGTSKKFCERYTCRILWWSSVKTVNKRGGYFLLPVIIQLVQPVKGVY